MIPEAITKRKADTEAVAAKKKTQTGGKLKVENSKFLKMIRASKERSVFRSFLILTTF